MRMEGELLPEFHSNTLLLTLESDISFALPAKKRSVIDQRLSPQAICRPVREPVAVTCRRIYTLGHTRQ